MALKSRKFKKLFSEGIKENIITKCGKYQPDALVCAISTMGRTAFSSRQTCPFETPKEAVEYIEKSPISDSDKEKICHLSAERLIRL